MKTILLICSIILSILVPNQINAQYPKLEVKAISIAESEIGKSDGQIQLIAEGERPPYVYQLFDKAPWEGGKELQHSDKTNETQYVFKNLTKGTYFVCITDSEENSDCEITQIK
jgi:hypothetical protein